MSAYRGLPENTPVSETLMVTGDVTLRDYFAAKVVPAALAELWDTSKSHGVQYENIPASAASFAY